MIEIKIRPKERVIYSIYTKQPESGGPDVLIGPLYSNYDKARKECDGIRVDYPEIQPYIVKQILIDEGFSLKLLESDDTEFKISIKNK